MSSSNAVVVIATLIPAEGRESDVETAVLEAVAATHQQDADCELYAAHRVVRGQNGFVIIEKWTSGDALAAHTAGPAFKGLVAALDGLLAEPLSASVLGPLPGGDQARGEL